LESNIATNRLRRRNEKKSNSSPKVDREDDRLIKHKKLKPKHKKHNIHSTYKKIRASNVRTNNNRSRYKRSRKNIKRKNYHENDELDES